MSLSVAFCSPHLFRLAGEPCRLGWVPSAVEFSKSVSRFPYLNKYKVLRRSWLWRCCSVRRLRCGVLPFGDVYCVGGYIHRSVGFHESSPMAKPIGYAVSLP